MGLINPLSSAGKATVDEAAKVLNLDQVAKDAVAGLQLDKVATDAADHLGPVVKGAVDELHLSDLVAQLDPIAQRAIASLVTGLKTLLIGRTVTITIR